MIRRAANSCVLVVHHSGKNIESGSRGSSALKAAIDSELELIGDATRMTLRCTKQKDGPAADPLWLKLHPVESSVVVVSASKGSEDTALSARAMETLDALRGIQVPGGIPTTAWKLAASTPERTFYRHLKLLLDHKLIENVGTDQRPRYQEVCADEPH
jgi:hypothetical protein